VLAKRLLAVLVAAVLIAAAFVARGALDDDADADGPDPSTPPTVLATSAGELRCITELQAVCATLRREYPDLRVTVQDAGTTLEELAVLADDAPRPLWLTLEPYPAMLDALRTGNRRQPFGGSPTPVAASELVVVTAPDRAGSLAAGCADQPLWSCIGASAGADWTSLDPSAPSGRIRPSLGDPDRHAVALASLAAAVAGYVGRPDVRAADWQSDPAFTAWFSRLTGVVAVSALSAGTPLATMAIRRSALDVAASTDAEVAALGGDTWVANYPQPSMWVQAVVAVPDGTAVPDDVVARVTDLTTEAGWVEPSAAAQPLPGATTMLALRTLWQEST
jgi:hypothetical protein